MGVGNIFSLCEINKTLNVIQDYSIHIRTNFHLSIPHEVFYSSTSLTGKDSQIKIPRPPPTRVKRN